MVGQPHKEISWGRLGARPVAHCNLLVVLGWSVKHKGRFPGDAWVPDRLRTDNLLVVLGARSSTKGDSRATLGCPTGCAVQFVDGAWVVGQGSLRLFGLSWGCSSGLGWWSGAAGARFWWAALPDFLCWGVAGCRVGAARVRYALRPFPVVLWVAPQGFPGTGGPARRVGAVRGALGLVLVLPPWALRGFGVLGWQSLTPGVG